MEGLEAMITALQDKQQEQEQLVTAPDCNQLPDVTVIADQRTDVASHRVGGSRSQRRSQ